MPNGKAYKAPTPFFPGADTPREQQKEFSQTWQEFAARKFIERRPTGNSGAIFTVPEGNEFIVTGYQHTCVGDGGVSAQSSSSVSVSKGIQDLSIIHYNRNSTTGMVSDHDFTMPLRIPEGAVITINVGAGISARIIIYGFLIPFVV